MYNEEIVEAATVTAGGAMCHGVCIQHRSEGPDQLIHGAGQNWFVLYGVPSIHWAVEGSLKVGKEVPFFIAKGETCRDIRGVTLCIQRGKLSTGGISIVTHEFVNQSIVWESVLAVNNIWALHDLLTEAEAEPQALFALGCPGSDIIVCQSKGESDLVYAAKIVCEVFQWVIISEIHDSWDGLSCHRDTRVRGEA